eukprot:TRINITY_DN16135_c0_g2_i1.p1 TRINITY_DN16135_c0_g2~~TRINITY_DN16135_c0_g2_i1.p1  ORF type:complete len:140 (+),score=15.24 TRINITY_DN16135_c0_g2_i1:64-483(+)
MNAKWSLLVAGLSGAAGVSLGAFGAHALKERLVAKGNDAKWATAVQYQMVHTLALLGISIMLSGGAGKLTPFMKKRLSLASALFTAGIVCFSGSIYLLCFVGGTPPAKIVGPITPLGGVMLIGGWLSLVTLALDDVRGL